MPNNVICPNCGTVNSSDSKKCQSCQAPIESKHHRFNSKDPRFWLILFVALFMSYLIGSYAYSLFKDNEGAKDPIAQVVPVDQLTDWHVQRFPMGVSLELPVHLTEANPVVDPELKSIIQKSSRFTYIKKNLSVALVEIEYNSQVDSLSMEGALDGSLNELKAMTGTNVEMSDRDIYEKDDMLYGVQTCNYGDKTGEHYQRKEMIVIKDHSLWNLIVCYDKKDKRLQDIANKIFYSFKINAVPAS